MTWWTLGTYLKRAPMSHWGYMSAKFG